MLCLFKCSSASSLSVPFSLLVPLFARVINALYYIILDKNTPQYSRDKILRKMLHAHMLAVFHP